MVETLVKKLERKEMQTLETTRVFFFFFFKTKELAKNIIHFTLSNEKYNIFFILSFG